MAKSKTTLLSAREISSLCSQLAVLIKSGLSAEDGVRIMLENAADQHTKSVLSPLHEELEKGQPFFAALELSPVFPAYMVQMVRIGEAVGKLEEVLGSLSAYYNREGKMRDAIKSAILYPVILIFLMGAVVSVLVTLVLPVFSKVFASMGSDVTGSVVNTGALIGKITLIVMGALLALALLLLLLSIPRGTREWLLWRAFTLPFLSKIMRQLASSRFALVISMMLSAGFDLDEALTMAGNVVTDRTVKQKIGQCRQELAAGRSFSESLTSIGLFTGLYARMISTGEKAGRLDEAMDTLAATYSDEVDETMSTLISVIEPTLVIILSVVIGAILLSIMLPLVEIMSLIA